MPNNILAPTVKWSADGKELAFFVYGDAPINPDGGAVAEVMPARLCWPAVEKAITMGFADPDRLFTWGRSKGGWSVTALLTQTVRFKAAMAFAGMYDSGQLLPAGLISYVLRQREVRA